MGRPRCTQESLGGHFEGTGLATSLEVRAGPSGYQGQQEDNGSGSPAVPAEAELRARGGIGVVQSRVLACRSWRRDSGHWVLVRAPKARAEQGRSRGPGSRAGGSLAHSGFRRGCVLLRPPRRTEGGRGGAGGTRVSGFSRGTAPRCVWAETSRAGASPVLALPGFCPLGPLDCQSLVPISQGSPVLTVVWPRFCVLSTEGFHTGT